MSDPITTPARQSLEALEELKAQWSCDPCWDIEKTEGFEAHRQELYVFRLETENANLREQVQRVQTFRRELRKFVIGDL